MHRDSTVLLRCIHLFTKKAGFHTIVEDERALFRGNAGSLFQETLEVRNMEAGSWNIDIDFVLNQRLTLVELKREHKRKKNQKKNMRMRPQRMVCRVYHRTGQLEETGPPRPQKHNDKASYIGCKRIRS